MNNANDEKAAQDQKESSDLFNIKKNLSWSEN